MATLGEVKERTRSLVEDEDADFTTDAYITPKINQAYGEAVGYLENASINPFATEVRDLPDQAAGITSFISATAPGSAWQGLENPLILEVKQVGQPVESYARMKQTEVLPNVSPVSNLQPGLQQGSGVGWWEWRGNQIYITPFSFAVDARLRAEFRPAKLVNDGDRVLVHALMTEHLSYSTAALIGVARGNSGWVEEYGAQAESTIDIIASLLSKQVQGVMFRFRRTLRRGRGR
jgi:hypothetical protein